MRKIPETSNRQDWARLVSSAVGQAQITLQKNRKAQTVEALTVQTVQFTPQTVPASPVAGLTYYDSGTNKLRTYDGTVWQDHW